MMNFKSMWTQEEWRLYDELKDHRPLRQESPHHVTTSSFVLTPDLNKVLFIYHRKYNSWSWMGGHLEKGETLYQCALRELQEESGVREVLCSFQEPVSLEKLQAGDHYHYNVSFLFLVSEDTPLIENKVETRGILWIPLEELTNYVSEDYMLPYYERIIHRVKKWRMEEL